jgi:hypothetical protein
MSTEPEDANGKVATGDRREDLHYEADPDQLVKVRATFKPGDPLPPQEHSANSDIDAGPAGPPIEDVAVSPPGPSVWDARPPEDEPEPGSH